jgi:microcystin-dependent protein
MPILIGAIALWAGTVQNIPIGWQLCDGTNNTPDLRNRFVIGSGNTYSVGNTGGSPDSILPSHTHTVTTSSAGSHSHSLNIGTAGSSFSSSVSASNVTNSFGSQCLLAAGAHTHTGFTLNNSGTTETLVGKNIPPWYSLAYIIQVA